MLLSQVTYIISFLKSLDLIGYIPNYFSPVPGAGHIVLSDKGRHRMLLAYRGGSCNPNRMEHGHISRK